MTISAPVFSPPLGGSSDQIKRNSLLGPLELPLLRSVEDALTLKTSADKTNFRRARVKVRSGQASRPERARIASSRAAIGTTFTVRYILQSVVISSR
jgi:hypothetical protein